MKPLIPLPITDQYVDELLAEIRQRNLFAELESRLQPIASPLATPAHPKQRTKQPWRPNERQQAILKIPRSIPLEKYCQTLDRAGVPFPEKWQKRGWPKSHQEAWGSKDKQLRNLLKCERNNVWMRLLKG
jgi:hypothetical protein